MCNLWSEVMGGVLAGAVRPRVVYTRSVDVNWPGVFVN